jgi:hypothetical protein
MRSLADRVRVERILRVVGIASLVAWILLAARPRTGAVDVVPGASLPEALPRWTVARVDSVHVRLDTVADARSTAWLAALRGAGVGVSWSGALSDLAVEAYRSADPEGAVYVLTSAPSASDRRVLSDALGPIDTLIASRSPSTVRVPAIDGRVTLTSGVQPAHAGVAPAATPRRVFVSGSAGWEAKFIVVALEESGWTVDARFVVGPQQEVWQGATRRIALDTSRYAAVVLVDSAAAEQTRGVEAFVRSGGGVVFAGDALRATGVVRLTTSRTATREVAPLGTVPSDTSWRGLSRFAFDIGLVDSAIVLELRGAKPVLAARRYHAGRVALAGYDQTWRWRMGGGENSVAEHREWWSRLVGSVAARPPRTSDSLATGSAPLARLYDVLGPPSTARGTTSPLQSSIPGNVLAVIALSTRLAEWLMRRSRGAK